MKQVITILCVILGSLASFATSPRRDTVKNILSSQMEKHIQEFIEKYETVCPVERLPFVLILAPEKSKIQVSMARTYLIDEEIVWDTKKLSFIDAGMIKNRKIILGVRIQARHDLIHNYKSCDKALSDWDKTMENPFSRKAKLEFGSPEMEKATTGTYAKTLTPSMTLKINRKGNIVKRKYHDINSISWIVKARKEGLDIQPVY